MIFPALYCFDHAIELMIKSILILVNTKLGTESKVEKNHNIEQLFYELKSSIVCEQGGKAKEIDKFFSCLSDYINELYSHIKEYKKKLGIDFARYPVKTDGTPHFYVDSQDNVVVDLERLLAVVQEVSDTLENVYLMYEASVESH